MKNLLQRPHRLRFLLALAAAAVASGVYVASEVFETIPATAAVEDADADRVEPARSNSVAILAKTSQGEALASQGLALEIIDILAGYDDIDVSAASSSSQFHSLRDYKRSDGALKVSYLLELQLRENRSRTSLSVSMYEAGTTDPLWEIQETWNQTELPAAPNYVAGKILANFGIPFDDSNDPGIITGKAYTDFLEANAVVRGAAPQTSPEVHSLVEDLSKEHPDWPSAQLLYADLLIQGATDGGVAAEEALVTARMIASRFQTGTAEHPAAFRIASNIAYRFDWNWPDALSCAQKAVDLAPGDARSLAAAADAAFSLGDFESSIRFSKRAIRVDPLVLNHRLRYARALEYAGKNMDAIEAYRELMALAPDFPGIHAGLGRALILAGRTESARSFMDVERTALWQLYGRAMLALDEGRADEGNELLNTFIETYGVEAAFQVSELMALADRNDEALEWLNSSIRQRDPGVRGLVGNPFFDSLRTHERWTDVLDRAGHNVAPD